MHNVIYDVLIGIAILIALNIVVVVLKANQDYIIKSNEAQTGDDLVEDTGDNVSIRSTYYTSADLYAFFLGLTTEKGYLQDYTTVYFNDKKLKNVFINNMRNTIVGVTSQAYSVKKNGIKFYYKKISGTGKAGQIWTSDYFIKKDKTIYYEPTKSADDVEKNTRTVHWYIHDDWEGYAQNLKEQTENILDILRSNAERLPNRKYKITKKVYTQQCYYKTEENDPFATPICTGFANVIRYIVNYVGD